MVCSTRPIRSTLLTRILSQRRVGQIEVMPSNLINALNDRATLTTLIPCPSAPPTPFSSRTLSRRSRPSHPRPIRHTRGTAVPHAKRRCKSPSSRFWPRPSSGLSSPCGPARHSRSTMIARRNTAGTLWARSSPRSWRMPTSAGWTAR